MTVDDLINQFQLERNSAGTQATWEEVLDFINRIVCTDANSVAIDGAVATALYSGYFSNADGGPISAAVLARDLAQRADGAIRIVDNTAAGEFLYYIFSSASVGYIDFSTTDTTIQDRLWAPVSNYFVEQTDGPVITITPQALGDRTFAQTEIAALADNGGATPINGDSRDDVGFDLFSSLAAAQQAYLLAVFNGAFAGDMLTTRNVQVEQTISETGQISYSLMLDYDTLAALGISGISLSDSTGTEALSNDAVREEMINPHTRGLLAQLFGPVMSNDAAGFLALFKGDAGEVSSSDDIGTLQDAVARFVEKIWLIDPDADVSSLIAIAKQASAEGDDINPLVAYFQLLTEKVQPYIEDAPEELKRDLSQSVDEIINASQGDIAGVPVDLQKRLAVTSGGRELYLLDQWRQEVLHPGEPREATLNGVGVFSKSETDLGTALYLTLGASSAYAIVRNSVEQLIGLATVPLREKIEAIVEHFEYLEDTTRKIIAFIEKAGDVVGDAVGLPFQNAVFGQFQYADGKAAVQAFDSSTEILNVLQLQIGADEATLIGNDNDNIAVHFGHGNVYGLGGDDKLLGLNSDLGDDGKALELHGGDGDDVIALAFGEGGFAHGDDGDDLLIGGGKEAHLFGGEGDDTFVIGSGTHIEDGEIGESTYFAFVQLFGGVAPWWSETNTAVWAPFTSLSYAFPVIGSELIALGAMFVDAATMNFARYRMTPEGHLQVEIGYGLGGNALIHDYELDLSTGQGTAGITVFKQGGRGKSAGVDMGIAQYVNLALYAGFGSGLPGYDPLVLDLDGDGFEVTAREYSQVYFDFEATGFAKQTGWVGGDDALLTRDLNANGTIDDGSELFGNRSQSGFAALGSLDSNADGIISSSDTGFSSLRIWRDLNQDGVSQPNELLTLADAGIASINLAAVEAPDGTEVRNNVVARTAQFTRLDGTTGNVGDITFDVSDINTRWTGNGDTSEAADALPQLGGLGLVRDLRLVMTDDSQLLTMVNNLVGSTALPLTELFGQVEAILYRWAGVDDVPLTALGGGGLDTRKLAFLEEYTGVQLLPRNASGAVIAGVSTAKVEELWNNQFPRLALKLLAQGPLSATFASLEFHEDIDQFVAIAPDAISAIIDNVLDAMPATAAEAQAYWSQWGTLIGAISGTTLRASGASVGPDFFFTQMVAAVDGRSLPLTIGQLADTLAIDGIHIGSEGALIRTSGLSGTQVWYADQANAVMTGGTGQDAYVFGRAIGNAVITDIESRANGDRIRFAFLGSDDVNMARDGNDLLITVIATGETVRVVGQYAPVRLLGTNNIISSNKGVEDIQFADGTIMEAPEIAIAVGKGTSGNDQLVGSMHTDVLQGGLGDDVMEGGDDADIYYVNAGEGHDIIRDRQSNPMLRGMDMLIFGEDVAREDLQFSRTGPSMNSLLITIGGAANTILVDGQFSYGSLGYDGTFALNPRIELFSFQGTADTWTSQEIEDLLIAQSTTVGNDTTCGFGNNDNFYSSAGNDLLIGMDGADTYRWGRGSGNDTIDEQSRFIDVSVGLGGISLIVRADTVLFGEGITVDDLVFDSSLYDDHLRISLTDGSDTLTVKGQFSSFQTGVLGAQWFNRVEWFEFADGSKLSWQDVLRKVTTGGAGNDELRGDLFQDMLHGGAGDDIMSGRGLGDTYKFNIGDGHDTLMDSNDEILGEGFLTLDQTPDILQFGAGITASMLRFEHNGGDIDIIVGENGDRVTLKGQDSYLQTGVFGAISFNRIEEVRFADGTKWTWQELNSQIMQSLTTSGDDIIQGFSFGDRFEASAGNDVMMGGESSDTYVFGIGSGNDIIRESVGNVFWGDEDIIEFAGSIAPEDLIISRMGDDLKLSLASGDSITVEGQFSFMAWFTWRDVELFKFSNGVEWTDHDIRVKLLASTEGDDVLLGFGNDDVLDGGAGNDLLEGSNGDDTYIFNIGYGHDVIKETGSNTNLSDADRITFGASINPDDLAVSRNGDDLILTVISSGETLTIDSHFSNFAYFAWSDVERFEFADGTVWTDISIAARLTQGTSGDDHIIGTFRSDAIDGKEGNDILEGNEGDDTYIFGRGYGHDRIKELGGHGILSEYDRIELKAGIVPADVTITRVNYDLVLSLDTGETLTVEGHFLQGQLQSVTTNDIEEIRFADGTVWTKADIANRYFHPTSGDDHFVGTWDDQLVAGLTGNDLLEGGEGADTYQYSLGDGDDIIVETGESAPFNRIAFGPGIGPEDLILSNNPAATHELLITFAGSAGSIRVKNQWSESAIGAFDFADGTSWTFAQIAAAFMVQQATSGDDLIIGSRIADIIDGGAGNDMLMGADGDDIYRFGRGSGSDTIFDRGRPALIGYKDGGFDTIELEAGISPDDVELFQPTANDLGLRIIGTNDQIVMLDALVDGERRIERIRFADGTEWNFATMLAQTLTGTAGDDVINAGNTPSTLDGLAGNDTLSGSEGKDIIEGGTGNDMLFGGGGNDVYRFALGDGADTVFDRGEEQLIGYDDGGFDRIELKAGIDPSVVSIVQSSADDLTILINGGVDSILLQGALSDQQRRIEELAFADGTVWTYAQMLTLSQNPTEASDTIRAGFTASVLNGAAGNDTLLGSHPGADILDGGAGNDSLQGGGGNDTYRFGREGGSDTILDRGAPALIGYHDGGVDTLELDAGIDPADVEIVQLSADDLALRITGTSDQIVMLGAISDAERRIEFVRFADGTVWDYSSILAAILLGTSGDDVLYAGTTASSLGGKAGNDTLTGSEGSDILDGGTGTDALMGGGGNDIYRFGLGDGNDTIFDRGAKALIGYHDGGFDRIELKAGIDPSMVSIVQSTVDDLTILINGGVDSILLQGALSDPQRRIEELAFADGTVWTYGQMLALSQQSTEANDTIRSGFTPSTIVGGGGDDTLHGSHTGGDILDGGIGNDRLEGGGGNDTYKFGRGSGSDTIFDRGAKALIGYHDGGIDTIELEAGIAPADVEIVQLSANDLALRITGTGDQVVMLDALSDPERRIEFVRFDDGTVWDYQSMLAATLLGTSGNDVLYAGTTASTLTGRAGNDTLTGSDGADILAGGTGSDTLFGGGGNDVYRFALGDGVDTIFDRGPAELIGYEDGGFDRIELGEGIPPYAVTIVQSSADDLTIQIFGGSDRIILQGALSDPQRRIEELAFADGTVWSYAQMLSLSQQPTEGNDTIRSGFTPSILNGGGGNDTLIGSHAGTDTLDGGGGDDSLKGGDGDDIYRFGRGDGVDTIFDQGEKVLIGYSDGGFDTIELGVDIAPADVTIVQLNANDLAIRIAGSSDELRILTGLSNGEQAIEKIVFADGTIWNTAEIISRSMLPAAGNDVFYTNFLGTPVSGGGGDDLLTGGGGADVLNGDSGNDTLKGYDGNDSLTGGLGADRLEGGEGTDYYYYNLGDGDDVIFDYRGSRNNRIILGAGITVAATTVEKVTSDTADMRIRFAGGGSIILDNQNWSDAGIEFVQFADGTVWDEAKLSSLFSGGQATTGNDTINGTGVADWIDALAGNDTVYAGAGADTLNGGLGNDRLEGGTQADTYIYNLGDGDDVIFDYREGDGVIDTLAFGEGIAPADIMFSRVTADSNDIRVSFAGQSGSIILDGQWWDDAGIEKFTFADGTVWLEAEITSRYVAAQTTSGNDTIWGSRYADSAVGSAGDDLIQTFGGNDTLQGGAGNDRLEGSNDLDTYIYNAGDGDDVVFDYGGSRNNELRFGAGINPADILFSRVTGDSNDVRISFAGQAGSIILDNQWWSDAGVEKISFADGTVWLEAEIAARYVTAQGTSGNDTIWGGNLADSAAGGAGDDLIQTFNGTDTLQGGTGNDRLEGSNDSDVYIYNAGDGDDVMFDYGGSRNNELRFGVGINPADIVFSRVAADSNDIKMSFAGQPGSVTFDNQWWSDAGIEKISFADGSVWLEAEIASRYVAAQTTSGNDTIWGSTFADSAVGGAGDDLIQTMGGADTIQGGTGNDRLEGASDLDVYIYSAGDGDDVVFDYTGSRNNELRLGVGINPADILFSRVTADSNDIRISFAGGGSIIFDGQWWDDAGVEKIIFADGTVWLEAEIASRYVAAQTTSGNDTIWGSIFADSIQGSDGNDTLLGYDGNDIIDGGTGNDNIQGGNGTDTASYASATAAVSVSLATTAAQNTLGAGTDTLSAIENLTGSSFNDTLTGSTAANTIMGGDGDDLITGGVGNDTVNGGNGTDTAKVAGDRATYTLQTVSGQVKLVDNNTTADGNDGTDTLVGIETVQFKDQSMGISSPIILDLDGNGVQTFSASQSKAMFDMDGDGLADDTSWIGSGDGLLFIDRDGNGTMSGVGEMSFIGDLEGAETDLEGLKAFDSNNDGKLSSADARFADFRIWRDGDGDGAVDQGEVLSLSAVGFASLNLTGTANNSTVNPGEVAIINTGSWTRTNGTVMQFADAAMTYFSTADQPLQPIASEAEQYSRRKGDFRLVAANRSLRLELRSASGALDPRAGEIGVLSKFEFKGREYGMLSPIVVDLDGDGIELVKSRKSNAAFDMDGNGVLDRTGWAGKDDGFLVIDRNADGKITSNSELAFGGEDGEATSSLEALAKLDSNRDGKLDTGDSRFGELKIWKDTNGNGVTDAGELIGLTEAGIGSIGLSALANEDDGKIGSNMVRSTATFTRTNGSVGTVGDVALAFRPDAAGAVAAGTFMDWFRQRQLLGDGAGGVLETLANLDATFRPEVWGQGQAADEPGDPAMTGVAGIDGAEVDQYRQLSAMIHDLASFGATGAAMIDRANRDVFRPADWFAH